MPEKGKEDSGCGRENCGQLLQLQYSSVIIGTIDGNIRTVSITNSLTNRKTSTLGYFFPMPDYISFFRSDVVLAIDTVMKSKSCIIIHWQLLVTCMQNHACSTFWKYLSCHECVHLAMVNNAEYIQF